MHNHSTEPNEHPNVPTESEAPVLIEPKHNLGHLECLMECYQRGDESAVRGLVATLSPMLFRFFRYQAPEQAEDLVQDTWLRIHRARHSYRPGEALLPWVFAIARRARVDQFRRNLRVQLHEISSRDLPETPAPGFDAREPTVLSSLTRALPAGQREVVMMLKVSGMTIEEVARATGSSAGAVKQKAHRAYRKLRKILEEQPVGRRMPE